MRYLVYTKNQSKQGKKEKKKKLFESVRIKLKGNGKK